MKKENFVQNKLKDSDLKSKQVIFELGLKFFQRPSKNINKKEFKIAKEILSEVENWELEFGEKDFSMLKNNSILVSYLAYKFGELVGLDEKNLSDVYISGLISEIGKKYICNDNYKLAYEYVSSPLKIDDLGFEKISESLKLFPLKTKQYLEENAKLNSNIINTSYRFHSVYSKLLDESLLQKGEEITQVDSVLWFANSLSAVSFSSIEGLQRNYSKGSYVSLFEGMELLREQTFDKAPEFWDKASGAALMGLFFTMVLTLSTTTKISAANYEAEEVVELLNNFREEEGLPPLIANEKLAKAAMDKAKDMLENEYWDHKSPSGDTAWKFIRDEGYKFVVAGENLARGYEDVNKMNEALINSASHKENIVNPKYRDIGIAVVDGVMDGKEVTLVVQMFGKEIYKKEEPVVQRDESRVAFNFKNIVEKIAALLKA